MPKDEHLMPAATNGAIQQISELLSRVATSASDGKITTDEAAQIRDAWEKTKTRLEGFVQLCEDGKFAEKR